MYSLSHGFGFPPPPPHLGFSKIYPVQSKQTSSNTAMAPLTIRVKMEKGGVSAVWSERGDFVDP